MRYPAFIAEMDSESRRRDLLAGIWSGYVLSALFALLVMIARIEDLIRFTTPFYLLVLAKLTTNTLAWICWRARKGVLETSGLNVFMDVVVMTGAIYATGGQASPLFSMYVVEIAVIAMLTNVAVTVLVATGAFLCYSAMATLVHLGVLPSIAPPADRLGVLSVRYALTDLGFALFLIAALTFYTSVILTRLRDKERALEAKTRELVDAGQQKSQFMANITHELRTPIHGIVGLAELMDSEVYGPVTDKQRNALDGVTRSAQNLLALIDDLLQLARADAARVEYKGSKVNVVEVVSSVVSTGRWMLGTKQVTIDEDVASHLPEVVTDRPKLVQILLNLLSNAIKFTPEGGVIRVTARAPSDDRIELSVADTGIGIPPAEIEHVFDPFRQVDGSSSRRFGGAGLGLSVVRHLADVLHAEVTVTSTEGKGSTFTVSVPCEHDANGVSAFPSSREVARAK